MPARPAALFRPALVVLAALGAAGPGHAAESYDNCTGFIDSLPTVIATQGTWCLRRDLATAITSGNAIQVGVNNVTIDCNDFKVGGLAGGAGTMAFGIVAAGRSNVTVRHCNVRGFLVAIAASGSGHVVEDNRVEGALYNGIYVDGAASVIRRNLVLTTGGTTLGGSPVAISAYQGVDVIDNTVDGSDSGDPTAISLGIHAIPDSDVSIANNRVRNVASTAPNPSFAISVGNGSSGSASLRGNDLGNSSGGQTVGIGCDDASDIASDNHLVGFSSSLAAEGCTVGPGNVEQ